nr:putative disease resistance RPP13-like protein 3 [Ziziphus jujuba var. spinosa]
MAESIVSFLLENLARLLEEEVRLISGVKAQAKDLHNQLKLINNYLIERSEAEGNHENDLVKEELMEQMREVAREAEDVMDKFFIHVIKQSRRNNLGKLVHKVDVHGIANEITTINRKIRQHFENRQQYYDDRRRGTNPEADDNAALLNSIRTKTCSYDAVGLEGHVTALVKLLTHDNRSKRDVISITGMIGAGKTKLAKKIYGDDAVIRYFHRRAWVSGSREHSSRDWLVGIMREFRPPNMKDIEEMSDIEALKKTVFDHLKRLSYLAVMDGMCNNGVWDTIRTAFPDDSKGSRILITSREKVVTSPDDYTTPPYHLPLLNEDESWQLLSNIAFRGKECTADDQTRWKKLLESCKGLPISIVVLGEIILRRELERSRSRSQDNSPDINNITHLEIQTKYERACLEFLAESYDHLPRRLKVCFLYLGLFPTDFDIPARQLVQLWSAEGFIKSDGRDVIKIAEEYLMELIHRNLIQVSGRRSDGGVKTCRVHELLLLLSKSKTQKEKYFEVYNSVRSDINNTPSTSRPLARTFSIHSNNTSTSNNDQPPPSTRSLLVFGQRSGDFKYWQNICKSLKHIRVLYLWNVRLSFIPKEIGNLYFLAYIKMCSDQVLKFPASMCSLEFLETIDIAGQVDGCLPERIWRMKRLRHLRVSKGMRLPAPPPQKVTKATGDGTSMTTYYHLGKLSTLLGLAIDKNTRLLMDQAQDAFPNVEKLHLVYDQYPMEKSEVAELLTGLKNLIRLKGLKIVNFPKSRCSPGLFPSTLEKITIVSSSLASEHFTILGELPRLRILKIRKAYGSSAFMTNKLSCLDGEFPKLEFFEMVGLNIRRWKLEEGAMPKLRRLVIKDCKYLKTLPDELWSSRINLVNLQLEVSQMPSEGLTTGSHECTNNIQTPPFMHDTPPVLPNGTNSPSSTSFYILFFLFNSIVFALLLFAFLLLWK